MTNLVKRLLTAFALLGLGASVASAYVHYQLLRQPGYLSFCDVSSTINCTDAYLSRYGSVGGVPVALVGAFWFAVAWLLVTSAGRGSRTFRQNVPAYLFVLSTLALSVVLYLAYVSWFVLGAVCMLCLVTYVAVVGLFALSGSSTTVPLSELPGRAIQDVRTFMASPRAIATALLLTLVGGLAVLVFPDEAAAPALAASPAPAQTQASGETRSEFQRWYESQPRVEVPVAKAGERVLIVKFNDYQCPPCRQTYLLYKGILSKYEAQSPGQVRFVTLDYPLDPECNVNAPRGLHQAACEAAVAVRLARERGAAERLEEVIFANQANLTPEWVRVAAREQAGVTDFDAQYARTLELVKRDIALGKQLGVTSTPTFLINGVLIPGGLQANYFDAAIAYELSRSSSPP